MSHTPGPWEPMKNSDGTIRGITGMHGPERVNVINWNGISRASNEIGQANARLIAAAPDGLEFAKYVASVLKSYRGSQTWHSVMLEKAEAFIAKSEGK